MNYGLFLKEVGRGERGARDLGFDDARRLFGAMLDGGVPELELGALLLAFRFKSESLTELQGFHAALDERVVQLKSPDRRLRPVVVPSYNGARRQANLMPLLVLLLRRMGVPVLIHGVLESEGRVAAAYVFRELGIFPQANSRRAQQVLNDEGLAFVPVGALAPGLSALLALRSRLGVRSSAHTVAKLMDPFGADACGGGVRMVSVTHPAYADKLREFFLAGDGRALLMRGTEGEAFANPKRRPQIEYFHDREAAILFEAEHGSLDCIPALPGECDARTTAQWITGALEGAHPIPLPILNQLACCLYASGFCASLTEAKAVAAVKARVPAAA